MRIETCGPSHGVSLAEERQADVSVSNECSITPLEFSAANQEEDAPVDDECDEDCESLNPVDPMTFAWQIARGMVSELIITCDKGPEIRQRLNIIQPILRSKHLPPLLC